MSSFSTKSSRKSYRKGGARLAFGRPITEVGPVASADRDLPRRRKPAVVTSAPSRPFAMRSEAKARISKMKSDAYEWIHNRDRNFLKIQEFKLAKRKLKSAAYSGHGIDYKQLFHYYDRDNDGQLQLQEFISAIRRDAKQSRTKRGWSDKTLIALFNAIDQDNSGTIEYEELVNFLEEDSTRALWAPTRHLSRSVADTNGVNEAGRPKLLTSYMLSRKVYKEEQQRKFEQQKRLESQREALVEAWWKDQHRNNKKMKSTEAKKVVERLYPYRSTRDTKFELLRTRSRNSVRGIQRRLHR